MKLFHSLNFAKGLDLSVLALLTFLSGSVCFGKLPSAEALGFTGLIQGRHSQNYDFTMDGRSGSIDFKIPSFYKAMVTMVSVSGKGKESKQFTLTGGQTHKIEGTPNTQVSLKVDFIPLNQGYAAGAYRIDVSGSAAFDGEEGVETVALTPPPIFKQPAQKEVDQMTPRTPVENSLETPTMSGSTFSHRGIYRTDTALTLGPGPVSVDTSKWPSNFYGYIQFREATDTVPEGKRRKFCRISIKYSREELIQDGGVPGSSYGPVCNMDRAAQGFLTVTIYDRHQKRFSCNRECQRHRHKPDAAPTSRPRGPEGDSDELRRQTPVVFHNTSVWKEGYERLLKRKPGTALFPTRGFGQSAF